MKQGTALLCCALVLLSSFEVSAQSRDSSKTYRWVDDHGVVHFGDAVPPEYAEKDKDVLNKQGIAVDFVKGKITEEELAVLAQQEAEEALKREVERKNRVLLATYQTEEEINMHRDRRLELVEAQGKVTSLYLTNLRARLQRLNLEAKQFRPYSDDPEAPPVPLALNEDMDDTRSRISRYEKLREENEQQADSIRARFEDDLERFRTLRSTST